MLEKGLSAVGYATVSHSSVAAALERLAEDDVDVIITDIRMPQTGGLELCRRVQESRPDVPVVVITAFGSMETAIEAIRAGAYDFLVKPFDLEAARLAVARAAERRRLVQQVHRLEGALRGEDGPDGILGRSPVMQHVFDMVRRVGPTDTSVTITGETGTGKELVARALHRSGPRSEHPFVAVNCAAMPAALLESELFGYTRGAFTDAKADREGLFAQAQGGTIFLDEVCELPVELQPKLLRVLQERRVRPVGGRDEVPLDVRVVCATNRDLERAVEDGSFREDLFYRINVIEVPLPPLRTRGNDILILARHFIQRYASLTHKPVTDLVPLAAERLLAYAWPGNVRELQNCIERAVTMCRFSELGVDDLPRRIREFEPEPMVVETDAASSFLPLAAIERQYIEKVYASTDGNKSLAASILGLNRKTLYRKLRRYGLLPPDPGEEQS